MTPNQNKLTRVEVFHDTHPSDPREDMDLMCKITDVGCRKNYHYAYEEMVSEIIAHTDGYKAAEQIAIAADIDPPDLSDTDILAQWVESIKPEVIIKDFWTGNHDCRYVASTTPKMCEKLGVKWEDAEKAMDGEIQMFQQWAEGDTWGVVVSEAILEEGQEEDDLEEDDWVETDACWGFYGLDRENGMRENVPEEHWPKLDHALDNPTY